MTFSNINTKLHNGLLQSSDPEMRELGELLRDILKLTQAEIDGLKKQVVQLQAQVQRR